MFKTKNELSVRESLYGCNVKKGMNAGHAAIFTFPANDFPDWIAR
jgi:hypothetical protein